MRMIALVVSLLFACGYRLEPGTRSEAQSSGGGGMRVVRVLDGGLCSGLGTKATPLDCHIYADYDGGISGTGSAGDPLAMVDDLLLVIFGDGSDGDVTISGTTTLSRDMFYDDLTVDVGGRLFGGGIRIHVAGTLTLNGTIHADGNDGANALNGTNATAACSSAQAGTGTGNNYFTGSNPGGAGASTGGVGNSTSSTIAPTVGTAAGGTASTTTGNNGTDSSASWGRAGGGASGGGFVGTPSGAGGAGGGSTQFGTTVALADIHDFNALYLGHPASVSTNFVGSGPGGGGGSCGKDTVNPTMKEPGGGGGGGGAASVMILARHIVVGGSGMMTAIGGDGGTGGSCGTHTGDAGGGGGGGGGSGGAVWFVLGSGTMPADANFDISGGVGGTGGTACAGGANGGNGGHGGFGHFLKFRADGAPL